MCEWVGGQSKRLSSDCVSACMHVFVHMFMCRSDSKEIVSFLVDYHKQIYQKKKKIRDKRLSGQYLMCTFMCVCVQYTVSSINKSSTFNWCIPSMLV